MTDDAGEVLDLLDEHGDPTGEVKRRADVHRDGDWHRAFHLWVMHPDGYVLLQRRSRTKDLAAGKVDVSVGGHLRAGEIWLDALREAEEEIGLTLGPGDVDLARREVLGPRASLQQHVAVGVHDPQVERAVPVAVAVDGGAGLR
ncbi:MAG: NUDIX domain-containing protein, partial [Trueperaceae bacterium]